MERVSLSNKHLKANVSHQVAVSVILTDEQLLVFNDANAIAKMAGTIGYEIMVGMRLHIKRIVVE